ncbi:MAG: helix-turn-helix domain-containing protein [Candidatus Heimdallarchaeota archaeon]|nr:helix-turn-helix domain-containing protein [Candidatus Heimdallarchaeota archaeon]MDH5644446.1 helix-turn-helix domain-containing protein [Candidatus Heimdallarchaeota archaeon]
MIRKLPPSAIEILQALSSQDSLTLEEIKEFIDGKTDKTMRYAMRRLLENGIVKRIPNLMDMRSVSYRLATNDELSFVMHDLSEHVSIEIRKAIEFHSDHESMES